MKRFEGDVISLKMKKTAVVEVVRDSRHPLYKKIQKRRKKYKVDIGEFSLAEGDRVQIVETRPLSKEKYFKIAKVLSLQNKK